MVRLWYGLRSTWVAISAAPAGAVDEDGKPAGMARGGP